MSSSAIKNYLRTHRKRSGLRQSDIALLLGFNSGHVISRYERLDRMPSLDIVFGCQALFDALPHELYPVLYAQVENLIRRRVRMLLAELEDTTDRDSAYRREVLLAVIERVDKRRPRL